MVNPMEKRDLEAALQTAVEVFEDSPRAKEVVEYIKALLESRKERPFVAVVTAVTDTTSSGATKDVALQLYGEGAQLMNGDKLYTELPRIKDHEFREAVNNLREITKLHTGTGQLRERLAYFLRDFEAKVRGEK